MYIRYVNSDPSNNFYGKGYSSGLNQPLFVEANPQVAIQLSRHCNGVCAYDVGAVSRSLDSQMRNINECSDLTGAPYVCTTAYMGNTAKLRGSPRYDRMG